MLKLLSLAGRLFWREWRAGQWYIVFISLLLAISATTSMNLFIERLSLGLEVQRAEFLGGDILITSPTPTPQEWITHAQQLQLRTAEAWVYPSVISTQSHMQLVNIQAISNNYPLLGGTTAHLAPKTVWVEPRLLPLLAIDQQSSVTIGAASFNISKLFGAADAKLYTGVAIAPRVMLRMEDVASTKTVIPGSRVDYRLFIAGEKNQINIFRAWVNSQLKPGQMLRDTHSEQEGLQNVLQATEQYFQLLLLVVVMMSGVAIAFSIKQYMQRHYSYIALWRCVGATQRQIMAIFILQLLVIALAAGVIGVSLGYLLQNYFIVLFKDTIQVALPAAGFSPILVGFVTSIILLYTFAYALIFQLPKISPLRLWREEMPASLLGSDIYHLVALATLILLGYWYLDYSNLVLLFFAALALIIATLVMLFEFMLKALRFGLKFTDGALRRGISAIVHHSESINLQFVGFTLIVTSLIVLAWVRYAIINDWRDSFAPNAPNYFAFNLAASDLDKFRNILTASHIAIEPIYPMVRGRLTTVNGVPVLSAIPASAKDNNALHRELNLSSMLNYPSDNKIVQGMHWSENEVNKPIISIEEKLAKDLNLHVGDKLSFQIGEQQVTGTIDNIRSLKWSSFHPNFFIIFPPGILSQYPTTYITSFYLPPEQVQVLNSLISSLPNTTVFDVAGLLNQIQDIIHKISLALQYLFIYTLILGILISITSIQASLDERRHTYHLLRILGASNKFIHRSIWVECIVLLLLLVGASFVIAAVIVYLIKHYLLTLV